MLTSPLTPTANSKDSTPRVRFVSQGKQVQALLQGEWVVTTLHHVENALLTGVTKSTELFEIHMDGITHLDTAGALLINQTAQKAKARGYKVLLEPANPAHAKLLKTSTIPEPEAPATSAVPLLISLLNQCGKEVIEQIKGFGQLIGFTGKYFISIFRAMLGKRKIHWTSLTFHIEQVGLRAVPIVALLTFLIGTVVAYMGSQQLAEFGTQIFAVNLLEATVLREMAVLITAIVVAGRSSSSFTAQIGSMVANEEVAAMSAMGIDPLDVLLTPRVTALLISLPLLVFIANIMALAGGGMAMWYAIELHPRVFLARLGEIISFNNFFVGMIKTPFFALVIGLVGCLHGFRAQGNAASVGFLTTVAVVQSIFLVIVLNAFFAIFFTTIGI